MTNIIFLPTKPHIFSKTNNPERQYKKLGFIPTGKLENDLIEYIIPPNWKINHCDDNVLEFFNDKDVLIFATMRYTIHPYNDFVFFFELTHQLNQ